MTKKNNTTEIYEKEKNKEAVKCTILTYRGDFFNLNKEYKKRVFSTIENTLLRILNDISKQSLNKSSEELFENIHLNITEISLATYLEYIKKSLQHDENNEDYFIMDIEASRDHEQSRKRKKEEREKEREIIRAKKRLLYRIQEWFYKNTFYNTLFKDVQEFIEEFSVITLLITFQVKKNKGEKDKKKEKAISEILTRVKNKLTRELAQYYLEGYNPFDEDVYNPIGSEQQTSYEPTYNIIYNQKQEELMNLQELLGIIDFDLEVYIPIHYNNSEWFKKTLLKIESYENIEVMELEKVILVEPFTSFTLIEFLREIPPSSRKEIIINMNGKKRDAQTYIEDDVVREEHTIVKDDTIVLSLVELSPVEP